MSYPRSEWGDMPPFKRPLRESFNSNVSSQKAMIYVSIPFLIEILQYVRAGGRDEFHYTHALFSEVNMHRRSQQKEYLPVGVKDYVWMQKDIDLSIESNMQYHRPCPEVLSKLREISYKMKQGREYVCRDDIAYHSRGEGLEPDILFYQEDYTL